MPEAFGGKSVVFRCDEGDGMRIYIERSEGSAGTNLRRAVESFASFSSFRYYMSRLRQGTSLGCIGSGVAHAKCVPTFRGCSECSARRLCLQGLSAEVKIARALDDSRPGAAEPHVVRSQDMAFSGQASLTIT